MPAVITNAKHLQLIAQTKKTYSTIANALVLAQNDLGSVGYNMALFNNSNTSLQTAKEFVKYFSGAKLCESKTQEGCSQFFYDMKYAEKSAHNGKFVGFQSNVPTIILSNGAVLKIEQLNWENPACTLTMTTCANGSVYDQCIDDETITFNRNRCGYIRFDVNGIKGPNRFGEDSFGVVVSSTRIEPESWPAIGYTSLKNILSGINKLQYTDYQIGGDIE